MKKSIISIIIIFSMIFCGIQTYAFTINTSEIKQQQYDEWTGNIRIEGEADTIFSGEVSVTSSIITAENMETSEMEEHEILFPSAIGALDEASKLEGFTYYVQYYPSWDALLVSEINGETTDAQTGWVYWVDYVSPMVGADKFELTSEDSEVLWGFLFFENWETESHALKISIEPDEVKKGEQFTVSITDELDNPIEDAHLCIEDTCLLTDENGQVTTSIAEPGTYQIYAEKEPDSENTYVRTEKIDYNIKKGKSKNFDILEHVNIFWRIINHLNKYN